jgi:hypothetical protein
MVFGSTINEEELRKSVFVYFLDLERLNHVRNEVPHET